ncbi:unnamed protein product [Closterium sp. Naga37s-1]|nr:unnamed protein product [Closterium sp. Naga37s-1]
MAQSTWSVTASAGSVSQEEQQSGASDQPPLVVATREKGKNGKLMKALSARGVSVMELPLIQHSDGPDTHRLPAVLQEPQVAGAEAGSGGGGTAEVFHQLGEPEKHLLPVQFVPSIATAKYLSAEIPEIEGGNRRESVTSVDEDTIQRAARAPVVAVASPTAVSPSTFLPPLPSPLASLPASPHAHAPQGMDGVVASPHAGMDGGGGVSHAVGWSCSVHRGNFSRSCEKSRNQKVFAPDSPGIESVMEALEAAPAEAQA